MAPEVKMVPFQAGDFIGSVRAGAPVNYYNVFFNPHGNGTHTECRGHITRRVHSINQTLKKHHFLARLISVKPIRQGKEDLVITEKMIKRQLSGKDSTAALVIRTRPNRFSKLTKDYTDTNPPYLTDKAMQYLVDQKVQHLLIDLPSVDREVDGGKLSAHHLFWGMGPVRDPSRKSCTITELIYVGDHVEDGLYLLNLQTAPIELDATPSRPVLFAIST